MTGKKKWIAIAGLFVVTFVLMFFYARQMRQNRMQKDIAKEILRLHVVANSDSKKDQALKMEVKEAVVTYLRGVMQDAESVDEARIQIQKRLPEIEAVAKEKMQQKGYSYDADATLSSCYFPVKTYGDMIFPAGEYEALKVNLGKSAGKNWWCVVYPQLCMSAAAAPEAVPAMGGMAPEDARLISQGEISFRFRCLELLEDLLGYFRARGEGIPTSE